MSIARQEITGVILAGGRGSRLGGLDKGLVRLRGRPLIEHAIEALRPQVDKILISANRHREDYAAYGFPVMADVMGDYDGPLAGILSALRAASTPFIVTVPCDCPRPPANLVERLAAALAGARADIAVASSAGRMQPVFVLIRRALANPLEQYLMAGERGAGEWMRRQRAVLTDFPDSAAFANINSEDDLRRLEAMPGPRAGTTT